MSRTHLDRFSELVTHDQFALAEACLLVAEDAYPDLNSAAYLDRLDTMASVIRSRLAADAFIEQKIVALNHYLYRELGFAGDTENYYDPRNSYLNDVIDRKRGIPITLGVLYIEIGRRLGLALQGVSFPGHFLVKLKVKRGQLVLDPFAGGAPQGEDDLKKRLLQVLPRSETGDGDESEALDLDAYLGAATPREIIARVLRNLKAIHLNGERFEAALAVLNRIMVVAPDSTDAVRDRGLVYARLECFRPAVIDLQNYLRRSPEAADATQIHAQLVDLKGRASRLN
jgi:regulator of sirC expression with transglutaminase-like and TPR domain